MENFSQKVREICLKNRGDKIAAIKEVRARTEELTGSNVMMDLAHAKALADWEFFIMKDEPSSLQKWIEEGKKNGWL